MNAARMPRSMIVSRRFIRAAAATCGTHRWPPPPGSRPRSSAIPTMKSFSSMKFCSSAMKTAPSAACTGEPSPPRSAMPPTRIAAITSKLRPWNRFATAWPNCAAAEMPASPQQMPSSVSPIKRRLPHAQPGRLRGGAVGAGQQQHSAEPRLLQHEPRQRRQNDERPALRRHAERPPGAKPLRRVGAEQDVLVLADHGGEAAEEAAERERRDDRVGAQRDDRRPAPRRRRPRTAASRAGSARARSLARINQPKMHAVRIDKLLGRQREQVAGDRSRRTCRAR